MSSSRQHGAEHPAEDPDPTGVRALLSSLPDPGPMPEHVVLRIQESLQREQQSRRFDGAAAGPVALRTRRERRERSRRGVPRWAPLVGAAAAVAAGAMVVSTQFLGGTPMADLTASVGGGGERGGADSATDAGDAGAALEGEEGQQLAPMADQDDAADEAGGESGGDGEDLAGEGTVVQLADRGPAGVEELLRAWYADGPGPSPWDADTAATCADAGRVAGPGDAGDPGAYPARWQDREAVVLLLPSAEDAEEAWVVEAGCLRGRLARVLHGPVELPRP